MWDAVGWSLLGLLAMSGVIVAVRLSKARQCNCPDCAGVLAAWGSNKVMGTLRLMAGERL